VGRVPPHQRGRQGPWTDRQIGFVTRLKENAVYEVVNQATGPLPANILADELIRFTGDRAAQDCPHILRRVVVWDERQEREILLLTNLLYLSAATIAAIYKDRGEIELFFKALKQNLKVKSSVGTGAQPEIGTVGRNQFRAGSLNRS